MIDRNKIYLCLSVCLHYIASYVQTFNLPKYISIIRHILANYMTQILGVTYCHISSPVVRSPILVMC